MEEDEIQAQGCKFPRVGGNKNKNSMGVGPAREGNGGSDGSTSNRLHGWHHSSRIIRVSRASGGKDRHSKVMTSKGLRDRRVRLSVTTAIQFYDLQDRLGYDQPSKAVEWLIKSAADAIAELPSLNTAFPDTPKQPSDEKRPGFDPAELDGEANCNYQNKQNNVSLSKSACSSTSETSKGSGLSLSRSDIRVKARERARERAAKDKKKDDNDESHHIHNAQHHNVNPVSQTASFTELLTGGISSAVPNAVSPKQQQQQQWGSTPMDYFSTVFLGSCSSSRAHQACSSSAGFSASQIQLGHSLAEAMSFQQQQPPPPDQLQMQQHFSFIPDHFMPPVVTCANSHHHQQQSGGNTTTTTATTNDYNLNFTMSSSSGLAGYNNNSNNRGTLQSNSPSHLLPHYLQRFSLPMDGSTVPFFIGAAAPAPAPAMENHQHQHLQFSPVFDGRLQLCYGDGSRHSDNKGKAKN